MENYSNGKRSNSIIEVGVKYFDNRYNDIYNVVSITENGNDPIVVCDYSKIGLKNEGANFILYHLDAKQHSKLIYQ